MQEDNTIVLCRIFTPDKENKEISAYNQKIDAILDLIPQLNNVKSLRFNKGVYLPNFDDKFKISDNIFCRLIKINIDEKNGSVQFIKLELSSNKNIQNIIKFIDDTYQNYSTDLQSKLGNKNYYFDHIITGNKALKEKIKKSGMPYMNNNTNNNKDTQFSMNLFSTTRSFTNIFFEQKPEFLKRMDFFVNRKDWYYRKGIPYTLGFMFYGEPGCGKTSTIKAIANYTKRHIININLDDIISKTQLKNLFYNEKLIVLNPETNKEDLYTIPINKRIYVIEDIDCMTDIVQTRNLQTPNEEKKEESEDDDPDKITLSCLLNILDGTLETPGRIIVITTNHPEKIDKALIRPGRMDMKIHFKKFNREMIQQMVNGFYDIDVKKNVVSKFPNYILTPAEVNAILFRNFDNAAKAIEELTSSKYNKK